MRALWVVVCAAVGCAGSGDDATPYSADKYGQCTPQIGSVAFDAVDVTTGNLPRCSDAAVDEWEFGATDCTHEVRAWRMSNGPCETIERRACTRKAMLVDDREMWTIAWRTDGTGTLGLATYSGSNPNPYCRTEWTLKAR